MSSPCRVCAKVHREANGLNLFRKTKKNINTLARLNKIVGMVIKQRKNMPDYICDECITRLTQAFEFRLECRRSQALLSRPAETKINQRRKSDKKVSCSDYSSDKESKKKYKKTTTVARSDLDQVQEDDMLETDKLNPFDIVKVEPDDFSEDDTKINIYDIRAREGTDKYDPFDPVKLEPDKSIDNDMEDINKEKMDVTVKPTIFESVRIVPKLNIDPNYKLSERDEVTDEIPISIKAINECSTINRATEQRFVNSDEFEESDPELGTDKACNLTNTTNQDKFDIGNGEKPTRFICETCGQTFNVQHYFNSHVNRHKGEQTFACEICPEKYYTQQSLKRHMLKHAGAQPNACRFCPRKFLDCSAKVRHERMHTNNRPYKCTYCDKAFTSNYVLKNHVLTHTGERPFSCKICQRSFTQKKHLAAHYKSTTHKQNEEKANVLGMQ